ncbi:MAG: protease HtpX [Verrucomicrobia bacterium]|nr:protease HtpX [Verrucomicrobiota bacterium]
MGKRILLFFAVNLLVVVTLSILLNLFHVQPFLQQHGLDIRSLLIFCLVWGMGGALISLALSKHIAKWMMHVRIIDPSSRDSVEENLVTTVRKLAREAHLKALPEVGIFDSPEPNAFATGPSQRHSLVAVSTGLLRRMSQEELEGVLGHEITHIANGDMVTMTLLQGIVNAFVMFLARILAFVLSGLGKNRSERSSYGTYYLFVIFFEIVFMVLGSLVVCAFSRYREFRADSGGAKLAGRKNMIAALESLKRLQEVRDPKMAQAAFQAFKISTQKKGGWLRLFATHPPLEERIQRLQN